MSGSGKTFRVEWARVAQHDLDEIADYLFAESPTAALRMVEHIEGRAVTLESMPFRGRIPPELLRFRLEVYRELQISPYRLVYRIYEDTVVVLGIFEGRRDLEDVILNRLLSM